MMGIIRSVTFALGVIGIICWHHTAHSMVGGTVVGKEDLFRKHVVEIFNVVDGEICTGTLIRRDVVLTAAHCFDSSKNPYEYIALFDLRIDPANEVRGLPAVAVRIPAAYDPQKNKRNSNFDIALIRLAAGAPPDYSPADVVSQMDYFLGDEETYIAAGYGVTGHLKRDPGVLRKLTVKGNKVTVTGLGKYIELHALGAGPCSGDSGSPLFKVSVDAVGKVSYSVIGVQSQAVQRAVDGKFPKDLCEDIGLYSNLPWYSKWLEENVDAM